MIICSGNVVNGPPGMQCADELTTVASGRCAGGKPSATVPEIVVNECPSVHNSPDGMLAPLPESSAPSPAQTGDLSVREEEEDWKLSASATVVGCSHLATSFHLLTPPSGARKPRSNWSSSAEYVKDKKDGSAEFLTCPSFSHGVVAAGKLENTFTCSSELGHSAASQTGDDKGVQDRFSAAVGGVAEACDSLQNGSGAESSPLVNVNPDDSTDYGNPFRHHTDGNFVSSAVVEVVADFENISQKEVDTAASFERENSVESRDFKESEDEKHSSVESKTASHSRVVTSLYVVVAADYLSRGHTSSCSKSDRPFQVDVSNCMVYTSRTFFSVFVFYTYR